MMAGEFTANLGALLMLLLCPRNAAFVPGASIRSAGSRLRDDHAARLNPLTSLRILCNTHPLESESLVRRGHSHSTNNKHQSVMCDKNASDDLNSNSDFLASGPSSSSSASPKTPARQRLTSVQLRFLRGGTPGDPAGAPPTRHVDDPDSVVEVSLNRRGDAGDRESGNLDDPRDLDDFLFLARSSQPGSVGHELQRRGIRFFPREAFVDEVSGSGAQDLVSRTAVAAENIRYCWETGTSLPRETSMDDLPRDEEGRARLVLWDPCGPDHPLIRAVEGEPADEASVEVLNFPQAGKGEGNDGDGSEFDELRSAVVFKRWFNVDQQEAIANVLGDQIIDDDEPGLATDRTHVPLIEERAALAAVGDGMLATLSSERFSEAVEGRAPPVRLGANRDFTAVCYGNRANMNKHRDTWKEWTLIVSIGNTISFELGTRSEGPPDVAFELDSGEGLLFNGHDLYHAVTGVKQGTAPEFWKRHPLSSDAGFARVGLLSLKGFSTKGASPRWGIKGVMT